MRVQNSADATRTDLPLESVALVRLIAEVRAGDVRPMGSYNRTYNRHNR
jgi:hypothetical protein